MTKNKYLVGYGRDFDCVYGQEVEHMSKYTHPMTIIEARKYVKGFMKDKGAKIFKLVEVKLI